MIRMITGSGLPLRLTGAVLIAVGLSACDDGGLLSTTAKPDTTSTSAPATNKGEQQDIEAPEVYDISEAGLWDGRPSLGGIWVAHPDVTEPHRVIIRNTANDTSVVGALFRRERDIPGPRIQASSEAAEALAMLPGAPVNLHVVALIREPAAEEIAVEETPVEDSDPATVAASAVAVDASADDVATDVAAPKEKKFRWPWSKPKDDTAMEGLIEPLETPADISETTLAPIEESAVRQDHGDLPAHKMSEQITELENAGLTELSGTKPPII